MSHGHGSSRRRNYGRRQSEVRRRGDVDMSVDLQGPDRWPRGAAWDSNAGSSGARRSHGANPGNAAAG